MMEKSVSNGFSVVEKKITRFLNLLVIPNGRISSQFVFFHF